MRRRFGISVLLAVALAAMVAPAAPAQKGVLGTGAAPSRGVLDPGEEFRYTALAAGEGTTVAKIATDGGMLERSVYLERWLVVPSVAYDGSPGGLSADGQTLVLAQPGVRFPQTRSEFTAFETDRLRAIEQIELPGTFTYDAISPDGRSLYLIEYTSPRDLTEYEVRVFDLDRGRLEPEPVVDPSEPQEEMYGSPITRAMSPDGRWAYTLYDGSEYPFIHALDTVGRTAVCIDLELLADQRKTLYRFELEPSRDGARLDVLDRGEPQASVDLDTFEVADPQTVARSEPGADAGDVAALPWLAVGGGLGLAALAILGLGRRRQA